MDNKLSIADAGSLLMGAGFAKLDDLKIGLSLIGVGVFLKVLVAVLNKEGIAAASTFEG